MIRGTPILAVATALVVAGSACRPAALLTRSELKMTVTEHEQAATAEDAHTPRELAGCQAWTTASSPSEQRGGDP
jgi:hypothetical protein